MDICPKCYGSGECEPYLVGHPGSPSPLAAIGGPCSECDGKNKISRKELYQAAWNDGYFEALFELSREVDARIGRHNIEARSAGDE